MVLKRTKYVDIEFTDIGKDSQGFPFFKEISLAWSNKVPFSERRRFNDWLTDIRGFNSRKVDYYDGFDKEDVKDIVAKAKQLKVK